MAYQSIWYYSDLPSDVIDIIERDAINTFEGEMEDSTLANDVMDLTRRNSTNSWIPSNHWISGFVWHYINLANRENFLYDLTGFDCESMQYTKYTEGQFYSWHNDANLSTVYKPSGANNRNVDQLATDHLNTAVESIRKLSVVIQLSDPSEYTGGNLQLIDENGKSYIAPRKRGTVILFDSRTQHRVLKVKSGVRRSIVAWAVGPRWK